eukprot:scaffold206412_cov35-Attheya_sp.AAC.1
MDGPVGTNGILLARPSGKHYRAPVPAYGQQQQLPMAEMTPPDDDDPFVASTQPEYRDPARS